MKLSTMPKQIEARLPGSPREMPWTRTVAVGALIAGVCLLLVGKRKAGVAVAAAGTAFGLAEDPHSMNEMFEGVPRYIRGAQDFLSKAENFVEQLSKQGDTVRRLFRR